jgi:hypothetical protein
MTVTPALSRQTFLQFEYQATGTTIIELLAVVLHRY